MIRKQIYIDAAQDERLKQIARTNGISEAALIRGAINRRLKEEDARGLAWTRLEEMLRQRPIIGVPERFQRAGAHSDRVGKYDQPG